MAMVVGVPAQRLLLCKPLHAPHGFDHTQANKQAKRRTILQYLLQQQLHLAAHLLHTGHALFWLLIMIMLGNGKSWASAQCLHVQQMLGTQ
jgi:hypothetical protein